MLDLRELTLLLDKIYKGARSADSLEGQRLDFKTEKSSAKETHQDLAEASVCFANASGGWIVLGVADRTTGPAAFVGTQLDVDTVRTRIHALTEPALVTTVTQLTYANTRLLVIQVPEGLDVYSTAKGLVTRRWNDHCLAMRPVDISRLDDERRGADWTAQSSGRRREEIEEQAFLRLRNLLRGSQNSALGSLSSKPDLDVLTALRLLYADGSLTRAGEILLCPAAGSAAEDILVYQYRQTPGGEAAFVRRWGTPMLTAFAEAIDVIAARSGMTPVNTSGGQQIQVEDYPVAAVREALANALLHGDYRERRAVQIEHSPESLSVRSPGPLVAGITPDNILTVGSRARFQSLTTACRVLGIAEELGQGVDRMFREMARTGRSTPKVLVENEATDPTTVVAFSGGPPNARVTRFISDLPEAEREDTDALLIILALCQRKSLTARDVSPLIQRDAAASEAVLRRLASGDAQLLEATAGTTGRSHPNYRLRSQALAALGPAVTYHRRSANDTDRKITGHVREYETINSATVQRIFDVDVYQARDILRDYVGREILVRVSPQTRGPKVKYGPGPQFPAAKTRRVRG